MHPDISGSLNCELVCAWDCTPSYLPWLLYITWHRWTDQEFISGFGTFKLGPNSWTPEWAVASRFRCSQFLDPARGDWGRRDADLRRHHLRWAEQGGGPQAGRGVQQGENVVEVVSAGKRLSKHNAISHLTFTNIGLIVQCDQMFDQKVAKLSKSWPKSSQRSSNL